MQLIFNADVYAKICNDCISNDIAMIVQNISLSLFATRRPRL